MPKQEKQKQKLADVMHVIIVHTLEDTMAAFEAAAELRTPLVLQSAPDALRYAGSLYLLHMFERARRAYPKVNARFILDCGDAGAEAVGAITVGHQALRSSAPRELRDKLADIAGQYGIEMIDEDYEPLDLRHETNAMTACREWLAAHVNH